MDRDSTSSPGPARAKRPGGRPLSARGRRLRALLGTGAVLGALLVPSATSAAGTPNGTRPGTGRVLRHEMATLWRAIRRDDLSLARSVFFPESAYLSMKSGVIPDPSSDYATRLVALFDLDVGAYHAWARGGRLLHVEVRASNAAWIAPGACENTIGYWHLPGVRMVLARRHRVASVGVFSLISWHGRYFVVHLGPNPRASNVGTLDQPRRGRGRPGPPGGC